MKKLWGGRFKQRTHPLFECFSSSFPVDKALLVQDLTGSLAHVSMLGKVGILSRTESARMARGLQRLLTKARQGKIATDGPYEDVHTLVQNLLEKEVGSVAQKLHTARSRNDQVALDLKLYGREKVAGLIGQIRALQKSVIRFAKKYQDVIIPGWTHLQHAQPVLLAHHALAYCEMLERDRQRLGQALERMDEMPLGAGAIAGSGLPIDRFRVAKELGFKKVSANSIDTVGDRDFIVETLAAVAILAMHLSRMAEEMILWTSQEFGLLEPSEAFCTGSSLMPQKKNPDLLELTRGQSARAYGNLIWALTMLKGLPLAYQRDLQMDKEPFLRGLQPFEVNLKLLSLFFDELKVSRARAKELIQDESLCATDLAEFLVAKKLPFHQAHTLVGKLVRRAEEKEKRLSELSLKEFQSVSRHFDRTVYSLLKPEVSVMRKLSYGSTGPGFVRRELSRWQKALSR